jgi:hypothetical protein
MKRLAPLAVASILLLIAATTCAAVIPPGGPRSLRAFDADRVADLEVGMWQAYYGKERLRLFALLVMLLHEQYHYSWATATREGFHLARAAATFGNARGRYEELVLPDLEQAYGTAKKWLGARFDPQAVARAELAWWVARRVPGENSPDHVGDLMAHAYALLYETSEASVTRAAMLRAQAAALRDAQEKQPDWKAIDQLLRASYRHLREAVAYGGGVSSAARFK